MPQVRASIPTPLPRHSPTTLEGDAAETRNELMPAGKSVGVSGATPTLTEDQRLEQAFGLPSQCPKSKRSLGELLKPLIAWGERSLISEYGFEGVEITDVKVVWNLPNRVQTALAAIEATCAPCEPTAAAKKLTELRLLTVQRSKGEADLKLIAAAYTPRLAQYPADVVAAACDAWANREEFWPSWAELKAECDKRMRGRIQIRDALRKAIA